MSSPSTAMGSLSMSNSALSPPSTSSSNSTSDTTTSQNPTNNTSSSSGSETPPHSHPSSPNSLETHLKTAYYKSSHQSPRPFFRKSPLLQKNLPNRILFYYGCFNPPHIAHLNLLRHIYTETSSEYNVIGAIVSPLSDEHCCRKFAVREDTSYLFSLQERREMWEKDFEFPDWACVVEWEVASSDDFIWDLEESVRESGFEVKFVSVIGPDYVNLAQGVYNYSKEVMVSDTGRSTDFITADGLLTLPGCTPWEKLQPSNGNRVSSLRRRQLHRDESQEYVRGYLAAGKAGGAEPRSEDGACGYAAGQAYLEGLEKAREGLPAAMPRYRKCRDYAKGYTDGLKTPHEDHEQVDDRKSMESSTTDSKSPAPKKFDSSAMYTCRQTDKADNVIFIPTMEDSIYKKYISSTDIRVMMSKGESNPKEITAEMASLVLGPHRKPQTVSERPQTRAERIGKSLYESSIFSN